MYLPRVVIGLLDCLCLLWLASVITLDLYLQQLIENCFKTVINLTISIEDALKIGRQ